jgi:hypothetical protein
MAEQGSDSATTEASVAESVRRLLDRSTRPARARQAGCLLSPARSRSRLWSECSGPLCLWGQDRPAPRPRPGPAAYPQSTFQLWTEEVRQ